MTAKISNYSTTPASNNATSPDGWPEGMAPSGLNNSDREFAARVREWYEDSSWVDYGDTINSSTSTTVSLAGNTSTYTVVGRAIRVDQDSTKVGWVTAVTYNAPNTSITAASVDLTGATQIEFGAVRRYEVNPQLAKVRAVSSTSQTITSGSTTVVTFGTETFDTMGIFASNTLTADTATAGYFAVDWYVVYDVPTAGGVFLSSLYKNGSLYGGGSVDNRDADSLGSGISSSGSDVVYLSPGDYLDIRAYQFSGVNIQLTSGSSRFSAHKLP